MKNKFLTTLLITTLIGATIFGQASTDDRVEKARQTVAKIGTGSKAKVDVKLRDSTKLKGYIGSSDDDSFALVDEKSGASRDILFAEVDQLKKRKGGLGTGAWIAIAAGAAVVVAVIALRPVFCDGGAGC